jgi:hypothetical protein
MSDLLRLDYINSLPHPFLARFYGDKDWWPVNDFEVQTGLMRIDVCGLLEVEHFTEVMEIRDGDCITHEADTFYSDWIHRGPVDDDETLSIGHRAQDAIEATQGAAKWVRKQSHAQ